MDVCLGGNTTHIEASASHLAILEDDDNAYIAANADLWKLLGREAAYSNAAEFDELMLSDDVFRL